MSPEEESVGFSGSDAARVAAVVVWAERQMRLVQKHRQAPPASDEVAGPLVYNDSGETIPAHGIIWQSDEVRDETGILLYIKGQKPTTTFGNFLVNGPYDIEDGKFGRANTLRHGRLAYDTGTPARGEGYGPKPGQWTASKGYPALARCQGIVQSTAKWLEAEFLPITTLLGKTTGSVSAGASAVTSYKIYHSATPGAPADAGFTTVPSAYYFVGSTIASDKWIQLDLINGVWYINPWECGA